MYEHGSPSFEETRLLSIIALVVSIVAAIFAYYQARLVQKQIQLQAILDLDREWRSEEMRQKRRSCWRDDYHPDEATLENVLEFLEKVSSFEEQKVIQLRFIWDTLGWYIIRYYHYCRNAIEILRGGWTHQPDQTLYQDLEALYNKLVHEEAKERRVHSADVIGELDDEKLRRKFIESEKGH